MENKFYSDDFEQFLKESVEDFKMHPSKRVWHSLYNNLHPGKKWPSLAVCLLLISSIVFIGLSHTNEITGYENISEQELIENPPVTLQKSASDDAKSALRSGEKSTAIIGSNGIMPISPWKTTLPVNHPQENQKVSESLQPAGIAGNGKKSSKVYPIADHRYFQKTGGGLKTQISVESVETTKGNLLSAGITSFVSNSEQHLTKNISFVELNNQQKIPVSILKSRAQLHVKPLGKEDREWIEDYAFHNQTVPSFKSKLLSEFYITPSIGYRSLVKNIDFGNISSRSALLITAAQQPATLQQVAALNVEAGYNVLHACSKSFRVKLGIQFNYTDYKSYASDQGHVSMTNLVLRDPYSGSIRLSKRASTIANVTGKGADKTLTNSTFQLSLPVGADLKLAGKNNKLQWFAGATLQPTYVLFGNAYLISYDLENYVYDASFLRKWNMNAGIETFLSIKSKNGVTLNIGPQLRYQLFSTYTDTYSYTEKLYNIGVKVGVIKRF